MSGHFNPWLVLLFIFVVGLLWTLCKSNRIREDAWNKGGLWVTCPVCRYTEILVIKPGQDQELARKAWFVKHRRECLIHGRAARPIVKGEDSVRP